MYYRMDWLEGYWSLFDCKEKSIRCLTELGQRKEIQGMKKIIKLRPITANQLGRCIRKCFQIYSVKVGYTNSKNKMDCLENITVIQYFVEVFPESILVFPPKRDIDFTIDLILGVALVSRAPHYMSVPELTKLKMRL